VGEKVKILMKNQKICYKKMVKNQTFGEKFFFSKESKLLPNVKIFSEKPKVLSKANFFANNQNFCQKLKIFRNTKNFFKSQNFCEKPKLLSKVKHFAKQRGKKEFFVQKMSKIKMFAKTQNFAKNNNFWSKNQLRWVMATNEKLTKILIFFHFERFVRFFDIDEILNLFRLASGEIQDWLFVIFCSC